MDRTPRGKAAESFRSLARGCEALYWTMVLALEGKQKGRGREPRPEGDGALCRRGGARQKPAPGRRRRLGRRETLLPGHWIPAFAGMTMQRRGETRQRIVSPLA